MITKKPRALEREDDKIPEEELPGRCVLERLLDQLETGNMRADSLADLVSYQEEEFERELRTGVRLHFSRPDQEEVQEDRRSHATQQRGIAREVCHLGQRLGHAAP